MPEVEATPWRFQGRAESLEERTGVEIVVATVGRCDNYPEIPWKAFALSAGIAGTALVVGEWLRPDWAGAQHITLAVCAVLFAGALGATLTIFWPGLARILLSKLEAEAEVQQYAAAMFLHHEWFRTSRRQAVLLLVAQFERMVVILPDTGLRAQLPQERLQEVIDHMRPRLAAGEFESAVSAGLDTLEAVLLRAGVTGNKQADEIITEHLAEKGV